MNPIEPVVKQLEELGLVAAEKLRAVCGAAPPPADAPALLGQLVEQNLLTKFQSQQVAAGRAKSLVFGSYVMLDRLPGAGPLFKARHRRVNRLVTIRPLPPTLTKDAAATARVLREVETSGQLNHPHAAAVQDIDDVSGAYYVVAELLDGSDLAAIVQQRGKLPVNEACRLVAQAAAALAEAHALGLPHRDLRAETLFVDRAGTVKVFGFGLTPPTGDGDARSEAAADVAALGRVLYRLLAAVAPPADAATVPSLRAVRPDVSPGLDAYVARMTSEQADARPTMAEVAEALKSPETLPVPSQAADESPFAFAFDEAEAPTATAMVPAAAPPSVEVAPVAVAPPAAEPSIAIEVRQEAAEEPDAAEVEAVADEEAAEEEAAMVEPIVEPAAPFSIGPMAASAESVSFAGPVASTFTSTTKPATARKPTKRVKLGPLPWEVDSKFLTPPYLIGGGAGTFILLALVVGFFVGGSKKPMKAKAIPVVPARASAAPPARPSATPAKAMFALPPSDSLPPPAPAKPGKR